MKNNLKWPKLKMAQCKTISEKYLSEESFFVSWFATAAGNIYFSNPFLRKMENYKN